MVVVLQGVELVLKQVDTSLVACKRLLPLMVSASQRELVLASESEEVQEDLEEVAMVLIAPRDPQVRR